MSTKVTTLSKTQLTLPETEEVEKKIASLRLTGSVAPLKLGKSLDAFEKTDATPLIGTEFARGVQLSQWVKAQNADDLIKDLAVLSACLRTVLSWSLLTKSAVSQRGVVFFRDQDLNIEEQKLLGTKLGELSGKPASSKLHIHPITEEASELGDEISVISSERNSQYTDRGDRSQLSA